MKKKDEEIIGIESFLPLPLSFLYSQYIGLIIRLALRLLNEFPAAFR